MTDSMATAPPHDDRIDRDEWRRVALVILAVFIATRLLVVTVALFSESMLAFDRDPPTWDDRPALASLTSFDAIYYLGIAEEGYHQEPISEEFRDWAFFPAYPAVVRATSLITGGDLTLAGLLVANATFLAAMFVLYWLTRRYFDETTSTRSVVYLAIAPGAVAFAMAYSDSLFLLLALGTFVAAERGRWLWMTALLAAATLTRLPGALLVIPLAVLIWRRPETARWPLLGLLAAPLALLAFAGYQSMVLGEFPAFLQAQAAWNFVPPDSTGVQSGPPPFDPTALVLTGLLLTYVFLFVYVRVDRIPLPYVAMAIVSVATILVSGRLLSSPRYLAVVWPFDWILANRRASWFVAAWPAISIGLFTVFAVLHFTESLAP